MENVKAITFDAGGTLVRPYPSVGSIYSSVLRKYGLELEGDLLEAAFRRSWREAQGAPRANLSEDSEKEWWRNLVLATLADFGEPDDFDRLFDELWITFGDSHHWHLYEGVGEGLKDLKGRGYTLSVLSNWDRRLRTILEGLNIISLFDHVVISSEVGVEKPDRRIFNIAKEKMGLPGDQILHVGDSLFHDIEPAKMAGWNWMLLVHDGEPHGLSDQYVSSFAELLGLLPKKCPE